MKHHESIIGELNNYIVRNVTASVGLSIYILVDTLFISIAAGAMGLTVLNLALPIYSLFSCTGLLLGVGGAAYFSLNKIDHPERVKTLYSELVIFAVLLGTAVIILINLFTRPLATILGANDQTMGMAIKYLRLMSIDAPVTMANYITVNFVRNDNHPGLTMRAALIESFVVIIFDWFFIFGLHLQIEGAALAAVVSPATSLIVLSFHKRFPYRQLEWHWVWPRLKTLKTAAKLGVSACLNELSTGVSIYVFNMVLLKLSGNYAVAAYGVISNIAIVTVAIANGVALGVQPLASREYGTRHFRNVRLALRHGIKITAAIAVLAFVALVAFRHPIITLFNHDHSLQLTRYAMAGMPIYFTSTLFSAINLLMIIFLTAINCATLSFSLSLLRGYVVLLPAIILMGWLFGINGVWAAVPVTELLITLVGFFLVHQQDHRLKLMEDAQRKANLTKSA